MAIPHFSVTEAKIAVTCPRQFLFNKKYDKKIFRGYGNNLGTLVHRIIEQFAKNILHSEKIHKKLETLSIEQIQEIFLQVMQQTLALELALNPLFKLDFETIEKLGASLEAVSNDISLRFIKLDTEHNPQNTLKKLFLGIEYPFTETIDIKNASQSIKIELAGRIDWITVNPDDNSITIIDFKLSPIDNIERDIPQIALYALIIEKMFNIPVSASLYYIEGKEIIIRSISFDIIDKFKDKLLNQIMLMPQWLELEEDVPSTNYISACKDCTIVQSCVSKYGLNSNLETLGVDLSTAVDELPIIEEEITVHEKSVVETFVLEPDKLIIEEIIIFARNVKEKIPFEKEDEEKSSKKRGPEKLFTIGNKLNTTLPVTLNPKVLLRHMVALGASGSGKTVLGKIIIEEALARNIPCILIDPQGDLCSLALPNGPEGEKLVDKIKLNIFTPNSSKGMNFSIDLLQTPLRELIIDEDYFRTILDSTAKLLLDIAGYSSKKITTEKALIEAILKQDWKQGYSHTMQSFAERIENTTHIYTVQDGQEIATSMLISDRKKSDLSKNIMKLAIGTDTAFFSGSTEFDIKKMIGKPSLNIINLASVGTDPNKRQLVVSWILRMIYDWLLRNPQKNQDNLRFILYIDEVADFMPPHPKNPPSKQMLMLLMRQARKYGCGMIIASQSPATIDYKAIDNVQTIFIGKITTKQSLTKIETFLDAYGQEVKSFLNEIQKVNIGEFLAIGGGNPKPLMFKTRQLFTKHQTLSLDEIEQILSSKN